MLGRAHFRSSIDVVAVQDVPGNMLTYRAMIRFAVVIPLALVTILGCAQKGVKCQDHTDAQDCMCYHSSDTNDFKCDESSYGGSTCCATNADWPNGDEEQHCYCMHLHCSQVNPSTRNGKTCDCAVGGVFTSQDVAPCTDALCCYDPKTGGCSCGRGANYACESYEEEVPRCEQSLLTCGTGAGLAAGSSLLTPAHQVPNCAVQP